MIFQNKDWRIAELEQCKGRAESLKVWRPWFAWYPVRVSDTQCVWLERVERSYPKAYAVNIISAVDVVKSEPAYRLIAIPSPPKVCG